MIQVVGRRLIIPDCDRLIGFEDDNDSRTVLIGVLNSTLCDVFGDTSGISASLLVRYKDSFSDEGVVHLLAPGKNTDKHTVWCWDIESGCVKKSGVVDIQLYLKKPQSDTENIVWHSDIDLMYIGDSIKLGNFAEGGEQMTAFEALLTRMGVVLDDMRSTSANVSNDKIAVEQMKSSVSASEQNIQTLSENAKKASISAQRSAEQAAKSAEEAKEASKITKEHSEHLNNKENPHNVTAEQIGAYTKEEIDTKLENKSDSDHTHTASEVGAYTKEEVGELLDEALKNVPTEGGSPSLNTNISIGDDNFSAGQNNSVGTRGFWIGGYQGTNGASGYYDLFLSSEHRTYEKEKVKEIASKIQEIILSGEQIYWTLKNGMNCDHWGTVTATSTANLNSTDAINEDAEDFCVRIWVTNFYSNEDPSALAHSEDTVTYPRIYPNYPALKENIKNNHGASGKEATLFLCGYPELGGDVLYDKQYSFGEDNINQGEYSFNVGKGNRAYGKYSSNQGSNNKAGYNCHTFGRNIDLAFAQECLSVGKDNLIGSFANHSTQFGQGLVAHNSFVNQFGLGLVAYKQFVSQFGRYNYPKARNLVEVGCGTSDDYRKNIFEVDEQGLVSSNEKYLPMQKVISRTVSFSGINNLINHNDGIVANKSFVNPKIGVTTSSTNTFAHYLYISPQHYSITAGETYCLIIQADLANVAGAECLFLANNTSVYNVPLEEGKNYLVLPFTASEDIINGDGFGYGCCIHNPNGNNVSYTLRNARLCKVVDLCYVDNAYNTDTELICFDHDIVHLNEVIDAQTFENEFIVVQAFDDNIFVVPLVDNAGAPKIDLYSSNDFIKDAKAKLFGAIDAIILKSSTEGSTKKFRITVDDSGTLTATQI